MNSPSRTIDRLVWGGLVIVIAAIVGAFVVSRMRPAMSPLPVIATVADFSLTNQNAQPVTLADLRGKVWVADIIFTRCGGPCPRMTKQMKELQDELPATSAVRLVTLTTDADFDTPPVLKKYGEHYGANFTRWHFLTGTTKAVADLAIDSLKLTAVAKMPAERKDAADLFVHSTIFVVVDKQARVRGVFETGGERVDWPTSKAEILATVSQLEREP